MSKESSDGVCTCDCHTYPQKLVIHCAPCCEGLCEGCGRWFVFGALAPHKNSCPSYRELEARKKRKEPKR